MAKKLANIFFVVAIYHFGNNTSPVEIIFVFCTVTRLKYPFRLIPNDEYGLFLLDCLTMFIVNLKGLGFLVGLHDISF